MMFIILVIFTLITVLISTCYYVANYSYVGKLYKAMPAPPWTPIVGTMAIFTSMNKLWDVARVMADRYYPIYALWFLYAGTVFIRHPDDVKILIGSTKHIEKSFVYKFLQPWLGTGLLTSSHAKWQDRRKLLTPAFHFNILRAYTEIIIDESRRMCESLKKEGCPIVRNLPLLCSEHTLNIICEAAMGCSLRDKGEIESQYRQAIMEVGHLIASRFCKPWIHLDWTFFFSPMYWRQKRILKTLHGFTDTIIQERKIFHDETNGQYLKNYGSNETGDEVISANSYFGNHKKRLAMLDLLIAAQRNGQIDDIGIREEVDTFMFEGHDTSAAALCFAIMLLAEHKEIQVRAREEFDAVLAVHGGELSMADLQRLPYLERCIKEILRLYPSVPMIGRLTEEEIHLGGYKIPVNSSVNTFIFDVHRDPNFWTNPEVFDPDRFLPENIEGRHPYCHLPFSAGPRNCIGQRFALLELKTMVGLLLHNFHLEPIDYLKDLKIIPDLVIRPGHPVHARFIPIA